MALGAAVGAVVGAVGLTVGPAVGLCHRNWSVKTTRSWVAGGAAVGRGRVSARWWFNMQNGAFESGRELGNQLERSW